jgi:aminoglycoside adenylyltransferase-like protein
MGVLPEIAPLLSALTAGMRAALGENLVGVYLRGSLAMGGFDPATSDVDFFTVTERRVSLDEFTALAALHEALGRLPNPYGDQLEGTYIERSAAWRYEPGRCFPTIGRNEPLEWSARGANWMLERWAVREHGIRLLGPDPRTLIAPVSHDELRVAILDRLRDWADFANRPDDPEWRRHRGHKAYVVETMCRALCTLATGELPTKPRAVVWALVTLPTPWRDLVERSRAWRGDSAPDESLNAEIQRFVLWAATQSACAMNHPVGALIRTPAGAGGPPHPTRPSAPRSDRFGR